jgi:hypothetical protein
VKPAAAGASLTLLESGQFWRFPKKLRDNLQRGHVDRRVRVEAIPSVAVDDHAAFDGEFLNLVLGVDAPADATVCAVMGPSKAFDLAASLDEPLFHAFL